MLRVTAANLESGGSDDFPRSPSAVRSTSRLLRPDGPQPSLVAAGNRGKAGAIGVTDDGHKYPSSLNVIVILLTQCSMGIWLVSMHSSGESEGSYGCEIPVNSAI
jgi:hypothetical protein